jgi:hypothetical protein
MFEDQMNCCDDKDTHMFLKKGENDQYMSENDNIMLEMDDTLSWEIEEFRKGYHNAIMKFQKQYNLRRKKASMKPQLKNPIRDPQQMNSIRKTPADVPSTSRLKQDNLNKDAMEKENSKEDVPKRAPKTSRETCIK